MNSLCANVPLSVDCSVITVPYHPLNSQYLIASTHSNAKQFNIIFPLRHTSSEFILSRIYWLRPNINNLFACNYYTVYTDILVTTCHYDLTQSSPLWCSPHSASTGKGQQIYFFSEYKILIIKGKHVLVDVNIYIVSNYLLNRSSVCGRCTGVVTNQ